MYNNKVKINIGEEYMVEKIRRLFKRKKKRGSAERIEWFEKTLKSLKEDLNKATVFPAEIRRLVLNNDPKATVAVFRHYAKVLRARNRIKRVSIRYEREKLKTKKFF
jgi:hypothetical protein